MDLGNAIKTLRKQKKITQKQLAELSEISTNALCSIETGQSFPSKATISRICASLNIPESYLLLFSISEDDIPEDKKAKYHELNLNAIKQWLSTQPSYLMLELLRPSNPEAKAKDHISIIEKHLKAYVAKNTFDYFIFL